MIAILSVMCIVPKYHCLLHDYDIVYSEIIVSSRHLNLGGAPAFMFCFTKGGKRDITLSYLHTPCSLQIYLMFQFHIIKLLVLCDFLMRQLNYYRIIVSVSFCHVTMKKSYMVNSMSPQKLFLLSFTYSRTSRN